MGAKKGPKSTRIRDLLRAAFPAGTNPGNDDEKLDRTDLAVVYDVPRLPPDLFGFSALLLDASGAYNLFCPGCDPFDPGSDTLPIPAPGLIKAREAGNAWRRFDVSWATNSDGSPGFPTPPRHIQDLWKTLLKSADAPVFVHANLSAGRSAPEWWLTAFMLMIAADEASYGIGRYDHSSSAGQQISWAETIAKLTEAKAQSRMTSINGEDDDGTIAVFPRLVTCAARLNSDIACVQPKSKTPAVGCTVRTLSQNLSLLPHRGKIKVSWNRPQLPTGQLATPEQRGLNILMIPFPYHIDPEWIETGKRDTDEDKSGFGRGWNWFKIAQHWLPKNDKQTEQLIAFIRALIKRAAKNPVSAVCFPEYALDWKTYRRISDMIRDDFPQIEILISGSSQNCRLESGNFVLSSHFYDIHDEETDTSRRVQTIMSRAKHHRWSLEKTQIEAYGFESALPKDEVWWEKIPLPPRELHLNVFRQGSVYTTLICEDLARTDPCHEALRALGPDLVFVLLMDGPQLAQRWSARYSTGLSDDPGSSVLTMTSRALIRASNQVRINNAPTKNGAKVSRELNWSIGLWKDDRNEPISISCPPDQQAALLCLVGEATTEHTFDGRASVRAWSWRLASDRKPIHVSIGEQQQDLVDIFCGPEWTGKVTRKPRNQVKR